MPKRSQALHRDYISYRKQVATQIGMRIKSRRLELGLSQEIVRGRMELERVYLTRSRFSRLENGEALPNAAEIIGLALVLNILPNWLLFGREDGAQK